MNYNLFYNIMYESKIPHLFFDKERVIQIDYYSIKNDRFF